MAPERGRSAPQHLQHTKNMQTGGKDNRKSLEALMNGPPGITQALSSSPDFLKDFQRGIVQIISAFSILPGTGKKKVIKYFPITCPKYMIQSQVHIEFQAFANSLRSK